jgi:hypothetical protein
VTLFRKISRNPARTRICSLNRLCELFTAIAGILYKLFITKKGGVQVQMTVGPQFATIHPDPFFIGS